MEVFYGLETVPDDFQGACVTLGVFDGLHRAHRTIIERVIAAARTKKGAAMLITFEPHPRQVLNTHVEPLPILTTIEEKIALLQQWGMNYILILKTEAQLLQQTAQYFIREVLVRRLKVCKVVIGYDYHFGHNRSGYTALMEAQGRELGFEVEVMPALKWDGELVKSSTIRQLISAGNISRANNLLGRPYSFSGLVVSGSGRGRRLGFPTANLTVANPTKLIPAQGVYCAQASGFAGVLNIGVRKTFGEKEQVIELHLIDYPDENLYGKTMTVAVFEKIRDEQQFASVAELVRQIEADRSYCLSKISQYKNEMEETINDLIERS